MLLWMAATFTLSEARAGWQSSLARRLLKIDGIPFLPTDVADEGCCRAAPLG
jgi:hypothetical protein